MDPIELLAPARDLACGIAAVDSGADAVYIGPPRFGARARAGNSLTDVETLVRYAHTYWARVYVTLNTLLRDDELPAAQQLIWQLDEIGIDGLIIQDLGLLECDLPPLPLIASTQMHNHTPTRIAFLEQVGFQRVILARELSLAQTAQIRRQTSIELECFVHGALCVCYSGQCYLSYAIGGRSGNRGECAQPCRRRYDLVDGEGNTLVAGRHLLSLKDLNLSPHLAELIEAGVSCFKIEGRLKDTPYVTNVVSHYRQQLDRILPTLGCRKSSSGRSEIDFEPDPAKTFNRGYTTYFLHGRGEPPGAIDTPKMIGQPIGRATSVSSRSFTLDPPAPLQGGDGLCFFDQQRVLKGTAVDTARGATVQPRDMAGIRKGTLIYVNHDQAFFKRLSRSRVERRIPVRLTLDETPDGFSLAAVDDDGNRATATVASDKETAKKPAQARATIEKQLRKTGQTEFRCSALEIDWPETYFVPVSTLNDLRRRALQALSAERARNRPVARHRIVPNDVPFPETRLSYLGNVLNEKAAAFYRRHGVTEIEPAAESGLDMRGRAVMHTRYCIKHQLGLCPRESEVPPPPEPLALVDEDGHRYELRFDCAACEMTVVF